MKKKAIKYTNIVLTLILILFGIIDVVNDTSIFDYVYLGYVLTVTVVTLVALIVEKRNHKKYSTIYSGSGSGGYLCSSFRIVTAVVWWR